MKPTDAETHRVIPAREGPDKDPGQPLAGLAEWAVTSSVGCIPRHGPRRRATFGLLILLVYDLNVVKRCIFLTVRRAFDVNLVARA
jgi:hypothetical protein